MSEWLTTGQMIDQLKVDEVAESNDGKFQAFWDDKDDPWLSFKIPTSKTKENTIIHSDKNRKWRILPKYVSFDEALKALRGGKKVKWKYQNKEKVFSKHSQLHDIDYGALSISILESSDWTIEG